MFPISNHPDESTAASQPPPGPEGMSCAEPFAIGTCAWCGTAGSTKQCTDCQNAPSAETPQTGSVFYCRRLCQEAHWFHHRVICEQSKKRRALYRAGELLRETWYIFCRNTYENNLFMGVEYDCERKLLKLHYSNYTGMPTEDIGQFPVQFFGTKEYEEAALVVKESEFSNRYMHELTNYMLGEFGAVQEEVYVRPRNMKFKTIFVDNGREHLSEDEVHLVRFILPSMERYILDLSGAQYGWGEVIYPEAMYMRNRVADISKTREFGWKARSLDNGLWPRGDRLDRLAAMMSTSMKVLLSGDGVGLIEKLNLPESEFKLVKQTYMEQGQRLMERAINRDVQFVVNGFNEFDGSN